MELAPVVKRANKALEALFSCGLVSTETTIDRLEELRDDIDFFLAALRQDLREQSSNRKE